MKAFDLIGLDSNAGLLTVEYFEGRTIEEVIESEGEMQYTEALIYLFKML